MVQGNDREYAEVKRAKGMGHYLRQYQDSYGWCIATKAKI